MANEWFRSLEQSQKISYRKRWILYQIYNIKWVLIIYMYINILLLLYVEDIHRFLTSVVKTRDGSGEINTIISTSHSESHQEAQ